MGYDKSEELYRYLVKEEYLNKKGNITDKLKIAIDAMGEGEYRLKLDDEFIEFYSGIHEELSKRVKSYEIKDASKRKKVQLNKAILDSKEFISLWNKIKSKTIYRLEFDSTELISKSIKDIKNMPKINSHRMFSSKSTIDKMTKETGLEGKTLREDEDRLEYHIQLPDIVTDLQNKTNLTRKTVIDILVNSKRLEDFKRNTQSKVISSRRYKLL